MRRAPIVLILLLGLGSLAFDLTLSSRLPSDADWAEAAGALRAQGREGDALQPWPAWAERARLFVDAMPVVIEEDLGRADYLGIRRLWVLSLPRAPWFARPDQALLGRGATPATGELRFGALALRAWDLHAPEVASDLTRSPEEHEVDYVARRCLHLAAGARYTARGQAGSALHVRAGVIGERAYDQHMPEIEVQVFASGAPLGVLRVPRTERDGTGWRRLDVAMPAGPAERDFVFAVSSADRARPFCLQAWTTR